MGWSLLESKVHKIDPDDRVLGAVEVPDVTKVPLERLPAGGP
jgi:hypothetical protein